MNDFKSLFSTFEATDSPPVTTNDYKIVLSNYELFIRPIITDRFNYQDILFDEKFSKEYPDLSTDMFIETPQPQSLLLLYILNVVPTLPKRNKTPKNPINVSASKGYSSFVLNMNRYEETTGDKMDPVKRKALTNFAYLESGYNSKAGNNVSSAVGYFGMIKAGRKDLGTTAEYLNNTNLLFKAASRLYDYNRRAYKPTWDRAKQLGLTDFQIMYGFWFRPLSMINWVKNGGRDDGYRDGLGTTLTKILNKAARVV